MNRNFFGLVVFAFFLVAMPAVGQTEWQCLSGLSAFGPADPFDASPEVVAISGNRVAVGSGDGQVAILRHTPSGWVREWSADVTSGGGAGAGEVRIALEGDTLLIGLVGSNAVQLRKRNGTNWPLAHTFTGAGRFGQSVALSPGGDTIAIGAPEDACGSQTSGGAVYLHRSSDLGLVGKRCAPGGTAGNGSLFGDALAFSEDGCLMVGQPSFVGGMIYQMCQAKEWVTILAAEGHENAARMGSTVAEHGGVLVGGAPYSDREDAAPTESGVVDLFREGDHHVLFRGDAATGEELGGTGVAVLLGEDDLATVWASLPLRGVGEVAKFICTSAGACTKSLVKPGGLTGASRWGQGLAVSAEWFVGVAPDHFSGDSFGRVCIARHGITPVGNEAIFSDGFESGDLSAWSSSTNS